MRKLFVTLSLLVAGTALAQTAPFPEDYQRSPCAPANACKSFERGRLANAGRSFLGFSIAEEWLDRHYESMLAIFKPLCAKSATCYTISGSTFQWCNDMLMPEFRATCDRFEKGSRDWEQCTMFVDVWSLGRDQNSLPLWKEAQACAVKTHPFTPKTKPAIVWMAPAKLTSQWKDYIRIYAVDPDTRLPVPGRITVDQQTIYASSNPTGMLWTYYPWKWPVKFNRAPNAQGHRDIVPPIVTVAPEGYPPVSFPMPVEIPKMNVAMSPARLKPGKNTVTVTAVDATTGAPVELRVMYGDEIAGDSNKPFTITVKGKRREVWATSLFGTYSDVVILPAGK
jgi:hypothetical protein